MYRAALIAALIFLVSCTSAPQAQLNDLLQTASGAVTNVKETAKEIQERAQNMREGFEQVGSGALRIKESLLP